MRLFILIFIYIFSGELISANPGTDLIPLDNKDIQGAKIIRTEFFNENTLWGYIDGGADLYLEYGFNTLMVQDVRIGRADYHLNVYRMNEDLSAWGVFSISRFDCQENKLDSLICCKTNYQLQLTVGKDYISVSNSLGSEDARIINEKIIKTYINKSSKGGAIEQNIILPDIFKNKYAAYFDEVKFMEGALGIQNGAPDWEEYFEGISYKSIYYLNFIENKVNYKLSVISFNDMESLDAFLSYTGLKSEDKGHAPGAKINNAYRQIDELSITYIESDKEIEDLSDKLI